MRRNTRRMSWLVLMFTVVALGLSACGRKGPPTYPEGSDYPKTYPKY